MYRIVGDAAPCQLHKTKKRVEEVETWRRRRRIFLFVYNGCFSESLGKGGDMI
jgi:hypothetical protein